jgi:hypothetical protein
MSRHRSFGVMSLLALVLLMGLLLGFHWIVITGDVRKLCVLPKDHLSFDSTWVSSSDWVPLTLHHPILVKRLMASEGHCLSY